MKKYKKRSDPAVRAARDRAVPYGGYSGDAYLLLATRQMTLTDLGILSLKSRVKADLLQLATKDSADSTPCSLRITGRIRSVQPSTPLAPMISNMLSDFPYKTKGCYSAR